MQRRSLLGLCGLAWLVSLLAATWGAGAAQQAAAAPPAKKKAPPASLKDKLAKKLAGGRFRQLNEDLYTSAAAPEPEELFLGGRKEHPRRAPRRLY